MVFGGALCHWSVSRELFGSNKYPRHRHAMCVMSLAAPKKFSSSIYMFPRKNNQTQDQTLVTQE